MYIERVRSYIRDLYKNDKKKYNLFIEKLTKILQTKYRKKNIKQSEVKRRVTEFLEGTQPKAEYFEAYLHAIDEISLNGAIEVLKGKEIKEPSNWREFLILSVEKKPLPKNIAQHFKDPPESVTEVYQKCWETQSCRDFDSISNVHLLGEEPRVQYFVD